MVSRMNMETRHGTEGVKRSPLPELLSYFKLFATKTHFYLEICVRLDHFIDNRKGLWRSED
ncbi:hypothetical protein E2C01_023120 [Portunus trituberculatus]|uniref:Uncharacterized protein n=1 Tax=Portunus trituberculatus TaxID=210409 RepID=A0A5B7E7Z1_PORTR|nr:hypothetical protein [Portunus trituberculatus]